MKTDSILRILTVLFGCIALVLGAYIVFDRINAPDPVPVVAGMGEEDDHGHEEETTDTTADAGMGDETDDHSDEGDDHSADTTADDAHDHEHTDTVEVTEWAEVPEVSLNVIEDGEGGYVALLTTEHFTFAPENVDSAAAEGEGHAHIYVNGEKISRVYGNAYWIGALEPGDYTIGITLSSNDHQELMLNGEPLGAEVALTVEE